MFKILDNLMGEGRDFLTVVIYLCACAEHAVRHAHMVRSSLASPSLRLCKLCERPIYIAVSQSAMSDVVGLRRGMERVEVDSSLVTTDTLRRTFRVRKRV